MEQAKHDPKARLKKMNHETKEALAELEKTYKPTEHDIVPGLREIQKKGKDKPDSINAASYSSGKVEKILKSSLDLIPSLSPTVYNSKFQKAPTKIEVVLSLSCWLSQLN